MVASCGQAGPGHRPAAPRDRGAPLTTCGRPRDKQRISRAGLTGLNLDAIRRNVMAFAGHAGSSKRHRWRDPASAPAGAQAHRRRRDGVRLAVWGRRIGQSPLMGVCKRPRITIIGQGIFAPCFLPIVRRAERRKLSERLAEPALRESRYRALPSPLRWSSPRAPRRWGPSRSIS